jgi:cation transport ATPase
MRYKISSDIAGRIRLRCGRGAFTEEQSRSAAAELKALPCVEEAEVSRVTGSVLVYYSAGYRREILAFMDDFDPRELSVLSVGTEDAAALLSEEFKLKLFRIVAARLFVKFLLPLPLQKAWCLCKGLLFLARALREVKSGRVGVEALDAAAIAATILRGQFSTASSVIFLIGLSDLLQEYTRKRTKNALAEGLLVHMESVWVERDGKTLSVDMSELRVGDIAIVRTGSMIPTDGTVLRGEALVNQSMMTGEAAAVRKAEGSAVFAGTVVEEGELVTEVKALSGESRISRIVEMISDAEHLKAGIQGRAERLADRIVPFNFLLAAGVFLCTRSAEKTAVKAYECPTVIKQEDPRSQ